MYFSLEMTHHHIADSHAIFYEQIFHEIDDDIGGDYGVCVRSNAIETENSFDDFAFLDSHVDVLGSINTIAQMK